MLATRDSALAGTEGVSPAASASARFFLVSLSLSFSPFLFRLETRALASIAACKDTVVPAGKAVLPLSTMPGAPSIGLIRASAFCWAFDTGQCGG